MKRFPSRVAAISTLALVAVGSLRLAGWLASPGSAESLGPASPLGPASVAAAVPPAHVVRPGLLDLTVHPADVHLSGLRDRQSVVLQASFADGLTEDVTAHATWKLAAPNLAKIHGHVLTPEADGSTTLSLTYGGRTVTIPVKVQDAKADRPIDFRLDVMPVFAKAGCNMGSCHGAARGKDGFRLSLFGFDPEGDFHRITRELNGRRVNLASPAESLIVEKNSGAVPHSGGKRLPPEGELHATVLRWLDAGAPRPAADAAKVTGIEVEPADAVLNGPGAKQQLTVRAKYSDGTDRDVTNLAFYMSSNDVAAAIADDGMISAGERGEAFVMARFDAYTVGMHCIVLPRDLKFRSPKTPTYNYIDELVHAKLDRLRIVPGDVCSDEVFLRRAYLDIVGLVPSAEEYERFLADPSSKKREALVDELLNRKEFVEMWVMKWAELLQIRSSNQVSYKATLLYFNWLRDQLAKNVPTDVMVRELLASKGGTFTEPQTNFYHIVTDPILTTENVAQVFMGMRIQCAQCHNHPFDRWTMDDYYGFQAFFTQIGRKRGEDPRETIVFNSGGGEAKHPVGGRVMKPKFLGGAEADVAGKDRREVLAKWLASPDNPYFATNLANVVWAHFLGRGIIDEVDDVRVSNPPVNPALLEALGKKFTDYKYDFRRLVRDICLSRTYQLDTRTNETNALDDKNFSHGAVRRLRAEVLLDVIAEVTEAKNKFNGLPVGARAVQIADGKTSTYFLTTFGRASRETVCSCEVKMEPNLSQALHLMNGSTVTDAMTRGRLIDVRLKDKKTPEAIIDEIYVRCLTRKPTADESAAFAAILAENPDKKAALEDIFWAVLNSREFLFNH